MEQDETDKAYASGREDASRSGDRMGYAGQVLLAIATGMTADLTGLRQVYYQPDHFQK